MEGELGLKLDVRKMLGAEEVGQWGQEAWGKTEGRTPTEAGKAGVASGDVENEFLQQWVG